MRVVIVLLPHSPRNNDSDIYVQGGLGLRVELEASDEVNILWWVEGKRHVSSGLSKRKA